MKKLKLALDALRVESFQANTDAASERGTVRAHSDACDTGGELCTENGYATCGVPCRQPIYTYDWDAC
jgi:hypothetical protein